MLPRPRPAVFTDHSGLVYLFIYLFINHIHHLSIIYSLFCGAAGGAKSCPPIKLFSADNLNEGLALAAQVAARPRTLPISLHSCVWET